jgi:hypothetical protein
MNSKLFFFVTKRLQLRFKKNTTAAAEPNRLKDGEATLDKQKMLDKIMFGLIWTKCHRVLTNKRIWLEIQRKR